jgi:tetratricopeptide (TPR) repeat protein
MNLRVVPLIAITSLLLFSIGCGKKNLRGEGVMDDAPTHTKQGMKYWDDGRYQNAEEEFTRAQMLDQKYAPAYSGLALVTAKKAQDAKDQESAEKGFKEAYKLAEKAQDLNDKLPFVYVAKGIVITMKYEGKPAKEWLKDVEDQYEKAIKLDPNNSEAYYRRGVCYKKAYEFSKAASDFRKVLDINKDYTIPANEQWEIVQKIERAAPGTDVGKKVALVDKISRADIAALFISELKLDKLVTKKRPATYDTDFKAPDDARTMVVDSLVKAPAMTDISTHWARNFINDIVTLEIRGLEPYPDHTFHPNDLVNRGEYALTLEDALIAITGDKSLATKYIGTESRFPDVNPSHPVYNAICTMVDRGVMKAELTGAFGIEKSVSGPDALLIIRELKNLNKIE